jgi:hypothetical protein
LGQLQEDDEVVVLGKSGNYFRIAYEDGTAYITDAYLTVSRAPGVVSGYAHVLDAAGEVLGQLEDGLEVTVTGNASDMVRIYHENEKAFIHIDNVDVKFLEHFERVSAPISIDMPLHVVSNVNGNLNIREEACPNSPIIGKMYLGEAANLIAHGTEWIKVHTYDDVIGFVSLDYVDLREGDKPAKSLPPASAKGEEVVAFAKQFLGTRYVWGGTNLNSGVDCSGFVQSVFKNFGINLSRTSRSMPQNGVPVNKSDLVAGDLVFFSNGGGRNIQHVGIYCGNGTFVHSASGRAMSVIISGMNEQYYVRNYISAARVIR